MKIERITGAASVDALSSKRPKNTSFSSVLKESVEKVNALQKQADAAINSLVLGDNKDIVQTVITMEKADISFRLMMQVRNKIMQAYEEVMRMQV
jgi:flagellar hook-basal body complex protein FliE